MNSSNNQHENTIANITNMNVKNTMHHEHQHLAPQIINLIFKKIIIKKMTKTKTIVKQI
jgi:hypothetical protein